MLCVNFFGSRKLNVLSLFQSNIVEDGFGQGEKPAEAVHSI